MVLVKSLGGSMLSEALQPKERPSRQGWRSQGSGSMTGSLSYARVEPGTEAEKDADTITVKRIAHARRPADSHHERMGDWIALLSLRRLDCHLAVSESPWILAWHFT